MTLAPTRCPAHLHEHRMSISIFLDDLVVTRRCATCALNLLHGPVGSEIIMLQPVRRV